MESAKWPLYAVLGNAEFFMEFDVSDRLQDIQVPCLILHGDGDVVSQLEPCGSALHAGLPGAILKVFPGVSHCPMSEDAKRTNALLARFLEERVRW